ncbi:MAG: SAM-dependent methyltransferase [Bacteroidales bacterium]|nr:SAM-dependent methyltransferase [Bacteroidales bacterium]
MKQTGKLYLIPNSLGSDDLNAILPQENFNIIKNIQTFIVENLRTARRFLSKAGHSGNIDKLDFFILNEHTNTNELSDYLETIKQGKDIGLLSDAGVPCVADPGADIVSMAQNQGIQVVPLVGPSSILMGLMASGFNGQNFAFVGYLPREQSERNKRIKELETRVYKEEQTQLFIETPYRNNQMFESLLGQCNPETKVCVACEISLETEYIVTHKVKDWKKLKTKIDLKKRNTLFLIYK